MTPSLLSFVSTVNSCRGVMLRPNLAAPHRSTVFNHRSSSDNRISHPSHRGCLSPNSVVLLTGDDQRVNPSPSQRRQSYLYRSDELYLSSVAGVNLPRLTHSPLSEVTNLWQSGQGDRVKVCASLSSVGQCSQLSHAEMSMRDTREREEGYLSQ